MVRVPVNVDRPCAMSMLSRMIISPRPIAYDVSAAVQSSNQAAQSSGGTLLPSSMSMASMLSGASFMAVAIRRASPILLSRSATRRRPIG